MEHETNTGDSHIGAMLWVGSTLLNVSTYFNLTPQNIAEISALVGWSSGIALCLHYLVKTYMMLAEQYERRRIKRINRRTQRNFERYEKQHKHL